MGTSTSLRTSGGPYLVHTIAFMSLHLRILGTVSLKDGPLIRGKHIFEREKKCEETDLDTVSC